jgi:hypothetical protein
MASISSINKIQGAFALKKIQLLFQLKSKASNFG